MSVNEKKWLVMHMHVQLQLDELRGPQTLGSLLCEGAWPTWQCLSCMLVPCHGSLAAWEVAYILMAQMMVSAVAMSAGVLEEVPKSLVKHSGVHVQVTCAVLFPAL